MAYASELLEFSYILFDRKPSIKKCESCGMKKPCRNNYRTNIKPERFGTYLCHECSDRLIRENFDDKLRYQAPTKLTAIIYQVNDSNFLAFDDCHSFDPLDIANGNHFESNRRKH